MTLLGTVALAVSAAGVVVAVAVAVQAGLRTAVACLADFLLAAGLLRLTGDTGWEQIVTAAAIVVVRHLAASGLAARPRADQAPPRAAR